MKGDPDEVLDKAMQKKFRSGVGKLRYLATWARPDILNSVREISRQQREPTKEHYEAMLKVMQHCVSTPEKGRKIEPNARWNGEKEFEFEISGMSDSNFNQCKDTRKSVSGNCTELNGVPVLVKSVMQETMKLSVTEAELEAATTNVQDMLFVKQIVEGMELTVKIPMVLKVDNQGVRDLINNWSVGGRTRHIATKAMFLRELKEAGIIKIEYMRGTDMATDIFTKNLPGPLFNKHSSHFTIENFMANVTCARESAGIEICDDQEDLAKCQENEMKSSVQRASPIQIGNEATASHNLIVNAAKQFIADGEEDGNERIMVADCREESKRPVNGADESLTRANHMVISESDVGVGMDEVEERERG